MDEKKQAKRKRTVPSQCYGCGRFIGPKDPAWATAYHPECDPANRQTR